MHNGLRFYSSAQVRELDRRAIQDHGIPGYTLMQRAAAATWRAAAQRLRRPQRVDVVCGGGNNGGDGYEIARLAQDAGCAVQVWELGGERRGDAATARTAWVNGGGSVAAYQEAALRGADWVVDALFGTGLSRAPVGAAAEAIAAINAAAASGASVIAVDIPSGLSADTGAVIGVGVRARLTVTYIGRKLGLYTGAGPDHAGETVFATLGVPEAVYDDLSPLADGLDAARLGRVLAPRARGAHKGSHGHVLVVGGAPGMAGAVLMAGRAALRAGAGLVSVATHPQHAAALTAAQPELMCHGVQDGAGLRPLLQHANVVALGPGLGQAVWGRDLWSAALDARQPLVVDADGLNWLAQEPARRDDWVLTPHPGEAARLLGGSSAAVQADRPAAARALQQRYGGVAVLKGAGTLVAGEGLALCPHGNPGMAVGGMGDVLTGVIAACLAQGLPLETAAGAGVAAHALAGDRAASAGERGLLPGDLLEALRRVVNR